MDRTDNREMQLTWPQRRRLDDFEALGAELRLQIAERLGEAATLRLYRDARAAFVDLLPQIPRIEGRQGLAFNAFLHITAMELAVFLAMKAQQRTAEEAWELCHLAFSERLATMSAWRKRALQRLMFSGLVKRVVERRAHAPGPHRAGEFEVEYVLGDGEDFDYGVDYKRCGNLELLRAHGGAEFAPYVCLSDIALSDALGWGLRRTETLAEGCARCDFRFRDGKPTEVSSKTPALQALINRLHAR